jgi:hypothetical protein
MNVSMKHLNPDFSLPVRNAIKYRQLPTSHTAHCLLMKSHLPAILLLSFASIISGFADHVTLNISTATQSSWTVTTSGITNATPFLFCDGSSADQVGLSISSRGDGSGFYLNGSNFSSFDGYWTATSEFYLPPTATNIVLTYTNLGFDDAGVLFLNTSAIGATDANDSATGTTQGKIVLVDGGASQTWTFTGPNDLVSGIATNGFILGGINMLTAIVNNTGNGATGVLRIGLPSGDDTRFNLSATLSYDVFPDSGSLAIAEYPGIQISGTIGGEYQIQYATKFTSGSWSILTSIVLTNSPFLFFDTNSISGQASRYYRAVAE